MYKGASIIYRGEMGGGGVAYSERTDSTPVSAYCVKKVVLHVGGGGQNPGAARLGQPNVEIGGSAIVGRYVVARVVPLVGAQRPDH